MPTMIRKKGKMKKIVDKVLKNTPMPATPNKTKKPRKKEK